MSRRNLYSVRKWIGILCVLLLFWTMAHIPKTPEKNATIESLIKTALEPVGTTMYIWGGGWQGEDDTSPPTSTYLGCLPQWKKFAQMQNENYDFEKHRYEYSNGLDCSGYVGWVLYNTFEKESGLPGYVTLSTDTAESLAQKGWGKLIKNPKVFLPGDIVSMEGHVWICLGTCRDGSVLLVHSSPPGVSLCGTEGAATEIAREYMTEVHPQWQEKYPNRLVSDTYLDKVSLFRWSKDVMLDAEEFQKKSAEEIMGILSPDM